LRRRTSSPSLERVVPVIGSSSLACARQYRRRVAIPLAQSSGLDRQLGRRR
jgi:hypothetical protein